MSVLKDRSGIRLFAGRALSDFLYRRIVTTSVGVAKKIRNEFRLWRSIRRRQCGLRDDRVKSWFKCGRFELGEYPGSEVCASVIFFNATELCKCFATTSSRKWAVLRLCTKDYRVKKCRQVEKRRGFRARRPARVS